MHVLTPGDHFSPLTGSAISTVVDGLAQHTQPRPSVLVASGTYEDRYSSADCIEYELRQTPHGASRILKAADVAMGRLTLLRPWARRIQAQALVSQDAWNPSPILAHNAPQAIPLIKTRHEAILYAHNDLLEWYTRREASKVLESAARLICVSGYVAGRMVEKVPQLEDRIRVVLNGVDTKQFIPAPDVPGKPLRVGYVGRIVPEKGVHVLVEAVRKLDGREMEVSIVGSSGFSVNDPKTSYEESLRAANSQIRRPIKFLPFQPRDLLPSIYAELDVLVVPSVWDEPFGLTVLEGLASGLVVVASRTGGIPEVAGGAALLFQRGNSEELAGILESLATSGSTVASMKEQARRRAEERTWRHAANDLALALS